jgi:type VI secretion system secreted protein Hcp
MLSVLFLAAYVFASTQMVIKVGTFVGESTNPAYVGYSDVLAFSWGMSRSYSGSSKGRFLSTKANFQEISITKYHDSSSAAIENSLATGKAIPNVLLNIVRTFDTTSKVYRSYTLTNAFVISYSTSASTGEDRMVENISLAYNSIEDTYNPNTAAAKVFSWNVATNKA